MNDSNADITEKIVRLMERDDSVDAPPDSVKWAKNLFRSRLAAPKKSLIKKFLAVLQTDLQPHETVFGERSASSAAQKIRQMFFETENHAIDLRITETAIGFDVHGQILGDNFANCTVKLGELETESDETSEFSFAGVAGGSHQLIFQTENAQIIIENLEF